MDQSRMAQGSFGYGNWKAPYWFIGPEQGKGPNETTDNGLRVAAWDQLGSPELCDCRKFHGLIGEERWHSRARLQSTWSPLIRLLLAYLDQPLDTESVRAYQRDHWGSENGQTCVIELSGLAARSMRTPIDRAAFRHERVCAIRERRMTYRPELIIMYGAGQRADWQAIAQHPMEPGESILCPATSGILACTRHPVAHGMSKRYWMELGQTLRSLSKRC